MNNVNIRPDKVNEIFKKKNLPIALKAGLISKLNVKVSAILYVIYPVVQHSQSIQRLPQSDYRGRALYCGADKRSYV